MDNSELNPTNDSSQLESTENNNNQLQKTILKFTYFQIVIAILQLVSVCVDFISHRGILALSLIALFLLSPLFFISVLIEVGVVITSKIANRHSKVKIQNSLSTNTQSNNDNEFSRISSQRQQTRHSNPLKTAFVLLFSLLSVSALLAISNVLLSKYFTISDAFSKEEKALTSSLYSIEIIKREPLSGTMTIRLDDDIIIDYTCTVFPYFPVDSGYGPYCHYYFSDGSRGIGEYIVHKNYNYFQELLNKYQDTLVEDNEIHVFDVKNQEKMKLFFSELMQNPDFSKAFKTFKNPSDSELFDNLDSITIMHIEYEGEEYDYIGLFELGKLYET